MWGKDKYVTGTLADKYPPDFKIGDWGCTNENIPGYQQNWRQRMLGGSEVWRNGAGADADSRGGECYAAPRIEHGESDG